MTDINEQPSIKEIGDGILMPQLKHNWRVYFELTDTYEIDLIANQAVRCSIDYISCNFHLSVQQNANCTTLHTIFKELAHTPINIYLHATTGGQKPIHSIKLCRCEMVKHAFNLDYSCRSDVASHELIFKFDDIIPYEIQKQ